MKTCTDGYPGCRVAEATGKWCAGQCEAMTETHPPLRNRQSHPNKSAHPIALNP